MYFSKDGNGKSEMQWKSLPEKAVIRFWKKEKREAEKESLNHGEKDGPCWNSSFI